MTTMTVEINLTRKTVIQVVCQVELHLFVVIYSITIPRQNYHRVCHKGNTTSAPYGAETAYPSKAHDMSNKLAVFSEVRVARSLVFCIMFLYSYLTFCPFPFELWVVCSSSSYGF